MPECVETSRVTAALALRRRALLSGRRPAGAEAGRAGGGVEEAGGHPPVRRGPAQHAGGAQSMTRSRRLDTAGGSDNAFPHGRRARGRRKGDGGSGSFSPRSTSAVGTVTAAPSDLVHLCGQMLLYTAVVSSGDARQRVPRRGRCCPTSGTSSRCTSSGWTTAAATCCSGTPSPPSAPSSASASRCRRRTYPRARVRAPPLLLYSATSLNHISKGVLNERFP